MPALDNIHTETESHPDDPNKTTRTIKGGESVKKEGVDLNVRTTTRSLPDDPTKSETIIHSCSEDKKEEKEPEVEVEEKED